VSRTRLTLHPPPLIRDISAPWATTPCGLEHPSDFW
jgi:hypothetical protein